MNCNQPKWSYNRHFDRVFSENELPSCYVNPDSIDAWIHDTMLRTLMPLLKAYPKAKWVTIGDGSYGSDCYFLIKSGADVIGTDINDCCLQIAKESGFIEKFKMENAEKLSFPDNSFDFVLCKQAYHHFPRPPIAFYEMLRVSRKALILIEPQETRKKKILGNTKDLIKRIFRKDKSTLFEPSGNYIFRINAREIEKMMTSLNYEILAIKRMNTFWHPTFSKRKFNKWSLPVLLTKVGIILQNIFCTLNLMDFGLAIIIVFKKNISLDLENELTKNKFKIIHLPKNPYLTIDNNLT
jgi:ubiquinone/menaquinone biosynthesis C-methylase UbiE